MDSEIFTVERAAALANCSSRTIERALASGALTATRVGMVRQISHPELDRFIRSRTESPSESETPEPVEPKWWSIAVGSMARSPSCGKCGGFDGADRTNSWQIHYRGGGCCQLCRKLAPPKLLAIHSKLTEQPSDTDRWYGVFSNKIPIANQICPINQTPIFRDFPWLIGMSGGQNKLLSMAGAEDSTPQLAAVIHAHRGTTPAVRDMPPAMVVPDPRIAERANIRTAQVQNLKAIVWSANAQDHPETQRKAEMLFDFLLRLIATQGME